MTHLHRFSTLRSLRWFALTLSLASNVVAAQLVAPNNDGRGLLNQPGREIDYPGCYSDLAASDRNGDGFLQVDEYLWFVQEYGKRLCVSTNALTLQQTATFNTLACMCLSLADAKDDCCLGDNAQIPTTNGSTTTLGDEQTVDSSNHVEFVCKLTDATMDGSCHNKTSPSNNATVKSSLPVETVQSQEASTAVVMTTSLHLAMLLLIVRW